MELFTKLTQKQAITNIASKLFESIVQTHIIHLQNPNKTLASHLCLGDYYSSAEGFVDDLVEKSFIKIGHVTGYKAIMIKDNLNPLEYLNDVLQTVEKNRIFVTESYINQIIDNIIDLLASSIYKLTTQPS